MERADNENALLKLSKQCCLIEVISKFGNHAELLVLVREIGNSEQYLPTTTRRAENVATTPKNRPELKTFRVNPALLLRSLRSFPQSVLLLMITQRNASVGGDSGTPDKDPKLRLLLLRRRLLLPRLRPPSYVGRFVINPGVDGHSVEIEIAILPRIFLPLLADVLHFVGSNFS